MNTSHPTPPDASIPVGTLVPGAPFDPEGPSVAIVPIPVTVLHYNNRGFAGIDAYCQLPDGRKVSILADDLHFAIRKP